MSGAAEQSQPTSAATSQEEVSLLDQIISQGKMARDEEQKALAKDLIGEFVDQVMSGTMKVSKDTQAMINARIAQIDKLPLQATERGPSPRGLSEAGGVVARLALPSSTSPRRDRRLKIKVMNVSKKDLLKDMERAPEFDQKPPCSRRSMRKEFGTFGGSPFGSLVGDYEFSRSTQDIALLEKVSNVAAAAHAPFMTAASPALFNWDDFTEMAGPRDLSKTFETNDYVKWRSFRDSEDSRYVGLCLPHILMRTPYGKDNTPVEAFNFEEDVDGADHAKYLWGTQPMRSPPA